MKTIKIGINNKLVSIKENSWNENQLGYYLAGLIEGDGSIIVPETTRNEKGKLLYPVVKITFVKKDGPLAKKIVEILKGGTLEYPKDKDYLNMLIQDVTTLEKIVVLINGKMRTPKIEALYRLIDWFNNRKNKNESLLKLGLDTSNLGSNAWLSGFIEADGNFYCGFNRNSEGIANRIKYYMRISQRMEYHRKNNTLENSYLPIMETIKEYFYVSKVVKINRIKINYNENAYEVRTDKRESCEKLINYLDKYSLYSSKYLIWLEGKFMK